jgi:hypothetical protein
VPRSKDAERAARYRARKRAKKEASKPERDGASSGAAFHQMQFMQLEWEQTKRENARLSKMVDDLQHQVRNLSSAMMANAGGGGPMPVVRQPPMPMPMPVPPPAEAVPVAWPRAPSFGASQVLDIQTMMINTHHDSAKPRSRSNG